MTTIETVFRLFAGGVIRVEFVIAVAVPTLIVVAMLPGGAVLVVTFNGTVGNAVFKVSDVAFALGVKVVKNVVAPVASPEMITNSFN